MLANGKHHLNIQLNPGKENQKKATTGAKDSVLKKRQIANA